MFWNIIQSRVIIVEWHFVLWTKFSAVQCPSVLTLLCCLAEYFRHIEPCHQHNTCWENSSNNRHGIRQWWWWWSESNIEVKFQGWWISIKTGLANQGPVLLLRYWEHIKRHYLQSPFFQMVVRREFNWCRIGVDFTYKHLQAIMNWATNILYFKIEIKQN